MSFADDIRDRPGVYLRLGIRVVECVQWISCLVEQSRRAFLAGRATRIAITIDGDRVVLEDDGDGVPPHGDDLDLEAQRDRFVAIALSTWVEVTSWHAGRELFQQLERGEPVVPVTDRGPTQQHGVRIELRPDFSILDVVAWDEAAIATYLADVAALSAGLVVEHAGVRHHDPEGLADRARAFAAHGLEPFRYVGVLDDFPKTTTPIPPSEIEVAIACDATQPGFSGFMRYQRIEHGTHREAVEAALCEVLEQRGVACADPFAFVRAFVHIRPRIPRLRAPSPHPHLVNDELYMPIKRNLAAALQAYFDRVPPAFDALAARLA